MIDGYHLSRNSGLMEEPFREKNKERFELCNNKINYVLSSETTH
jgi:hypothetical protein